MDLLTKKRSIIKRYKKRGRVICYITQSLISTGKTIFKVHTGKPSDASCLVWTYDNLNDAEKTAQEYHDNY